MWQLSLFLRFYSRVSEKIFRKFVYYSMNPHSLDDAFGAVVQLLLHHRCLLIELDLLLQDFVVELLHRHIELVLEV